MRSLRFGALIILLATQLGVGAASADEGKAALLPFRGAQASKIRQNVQKGLREADVRMVTLKQASAVAQKTQGYAKQASRLGAKVLVRARIRRMEGRWIADVEVRNARGQRVDRARTSSSSLSRLSHRIVTGLMKTGRMPVAPTAPPAASAPKAQPASSDRPKIVVRPFTGAQAGKIRGAAVRSLRLEHLDFVPNKQFVESARAMGVELESEGDHVAPARVLSVSGLIEGDVLHEDGIWSAYVRLVDGKSSKVISQHFYDASSSAALVKVIQAEVGPDFRREIRKLGASARLSASAAPKAPSAASKRSSVQKKQAAAPHARRGAKATRPAAVDIEIDFRLARRRLTYEDDIRGDLRDYKLDIGPGVGAKFEYYPGAHFTAGVGSQFGVDFEWERLFNFESLRPDGQKFPTESQQFLVGLRWRYPKERWEPYVVLDYGVHSFRFGVSGPAVPGQDNTAGIPSVKYELVRFGAGFRVRLGKKERFILAGNLAFRGVFSVGAIGTNLWFPEAKANGMDTGLAFGYALPQGFEIRLGIDYRRYGFRLNPVPPDPPYVAGGALDRYGGFSFGVAWRR